jgi:hypothetical protein
MAWLSQVFYLPTLWALKLSILGLYSRLTTEPLHRKILIGFASVITAHAFAATIVNINICKPQRIIWDVDLFPKGCINLLDFNYFNAAFHITTDVALVILPIPILSGLQVSTRKKGKFYTSAFSGVRVRHKLTNNYSWPDLCFLRRTLSCCPHHRPRRFSLGLGKFSLGLFVVWDTVSF